MSSFRVKPLKWLKYLRFGNGGFWDEDQT